MIGLTNRAFLCRITTYAIELGSAHHATHISCDTPGIIKRAASIWWIRVEIILIFTNCTLVIDITPNTVIVSGAGNTCYSCCDTPSICCLAASIRWSWKESKSALTDSTSIGHITSLTIQITRPTGHASDSCLTLREISQTTSFSVTRWQWIVSFACRTLILTIALDTVVRCGTRLTSYPWLGAPGELCEAASYRSCWIHHVICVTCRTNILDIASVTIEICWAWHAFILCEAPGLTIWATSCWIYR